MVRHVHESAIVDCTIGALYWVETKAVTGLVEHAAETRNHQFRAFLSRFTLFIFNPGTTRYVEMVASRALSSDGIECLSGVDMILEEMSLYSIMRHVFFCPVLSFFP